MEENTAETAAQTSVAKTAVGSNSEIRRRSKRISYLVRISAAVIIALLVVYFILILNSMSAVSGHVENRKESSYPASVAAGHIETDLAQIQNVAHFITSLKNTDYESDTFRQDLQALNDNINSQLEILKTIYTDSTEDVARLSMGYDLLVAHMNHLLDLYDDDSVSNETINRYALSEINPLTEELIRIDNEILNTTTKDIDDLYDFVNNAVKLTIILSFILMIAVFLTILVYMFLLHKKEEQEKLLTDNLQDALAIAQRASEAKSAFLGNMSHDMRTPLNAIIGLTAIAQDCTDNPNRMPQLLAQIDSSSHHLLHLINDALDMTKIESGKISLADETFSLPELISDIATINRLQANEHNLSISFVMDNVVHEFYKGDPMRIRQVLLNIISNALKYTKEGGSITVVAEEKPCADTRFTELCFEIKDTGVGMDKEFLKYIFEPFERERNDYTNFVEGTGLGMAITKNLITMMGGWIDVESEVGVGSTFSLGIPLKTVNKMPSLDTKRLRNARILVVDDNPVNMENTLRLLKEFEMDAEGCYFQVDFIRETGKKVTDSRPYNVVLVDLSIPAKDAIQNIAEDAGNFPNLGKPPILLASNNWSGVSEEDAKKIGDVSLLNKPLFRSRLYEALIDVSHYWNEDAAAYILTSNKQNGRSSGTDAESFGNQNGAQADEIASSTEGIGDTAQTDPVDERRLEKLETKKPEKPKLNGRILIVEDNDLNLDIATELVSRLGPSVEQATDGVEAVEMVKNAPEGYYDLIFMDWQMPRMNGIEATEQIVEYFKTNNMKPTPIIAMTANAFNEDRRIALDSGMDGFMAKPIDVKELETNLRAYLRHQS